MHGRKNDRWSIGRRDGTRDRQSGSACRCRAPISAFAQRGIRAPGAAWAIARQRSFGNGGSDSGDTAASQAPDSGAGASCDEPVPQDLTVSIIWRSAVSTLSRPSHSASNRSRREACPHQRLQRKTDRAARSSHLQTLVWRTLVIVTKIPMMKGL